MYIKVFWACAKSKYKWGYKMNAVCFLDLQFPLISHWITSSVYPAFKEKIDKSSSGLLK